MEKIVERNISNIGGSVFSTLQLESIVKGFLLLFVLVLIGHELAAFSHTPDDAYISYRYAKNFADGYGLVFNVGERVEGYTNFLWVVVLAAFIKFGADPVMVSKVLGVALSLGTLLLTYKFGKVMFEPRLFLSLVAVVLLAFSSSYAEWSVAGLETPLFTFLMVAGAYRYSQEQAQDRIPLTSSFLFALASLTRPEGVLLFGVTCFDRLVYRRGRWRKLFKESLIALTVFIALFGAHFLWRLGYYGYPLPNTFYVKTGGGVYQILRGFDYLLGFVTDYGGFLFVLPLFLFLRPKIDFRVRYLGFVIIVYSLYIVWVGGDFMNRYRFFAPILPFIYLLVQGAMISIADVLELLTRQNLIAQGRRLTVVAMAFIFLTFLFVVAPPLYDAMWTKLKVSQTLAATGLGETSSATKMEAAGKSIGKWLRTYARPDDTIAVSQAGIVPYYSSLYTIDMLGLNDLHIAHREMPEMGLGMAGQEKYDFAYVLDRRPTYILGPDIPGIPVDPSTGLILSPESVPVNTPNAIRDLVMRFHRMYQPLEVHLENGQTFYISRLRSQLLEEE